MPRIEKKGKKMDISIRDLSMMYKDSVVMWKGSPVYVKRINDDYTFCVWDLGQQKLRVLKWIPENFIAPSVRVGYINLGTNCCYAHRVPIRRYKIGFSNENLRRLPTQHKLKHEEEDEAIASIVGLKTKSLYDALMNNYPSLDEAIREAKECGGVIAFDKQFAVGFDSSIYFKGKKVGYCEGSEILFDKDFEYLHRALISR